jgi:hypothetical protein
MSDDGESAKTYQDAKRLHENSGHSARRFLMNALPFFSACFAAELLISYTNMLEWIYSLKVWTFNGHGIVFESAPADAWILLSIGGLMFSLLVFAIFYLMTSRIMRVESWMIAVIFILIGSFIGNLAGFVLFYWPSGFYFAVFSGNLRYSIWGGLLYSIITGEWLQIALISTGGAFIGNVKRRAKAKLPFM